MSQVLRELLQAGHYPDLLARSDLGLRARDVDRMKTLLNQEAPADQLAEGLRALDSHLAEGPGPGGHGLRCPTEERLHAQLHEIVELTEAAVHQLASRMSDAAEQIRHSNPRGPRSDLTRLDRFSDLLEAGRSLLIAPPSVLAVALETGENSGLIDQLESAVRGLHLAFLDELTRIGDRLRGGGDDRTRFELWDRFGQLAEGLSQLAEAIHASPALSQSQANLNS
jgi:hypothetical protein